MKSNMITKMITLCLCMVVVGFASDNNQAQLNKMKEQIRLTPDQGPRPIEREIHFILDQKNNQVMIEKPGYTEIIIINEENPDIPQGNRNTEVEFYGCNDYWASESSFDIYSNDGGWYYWGGGGYYTSSWGGYGCGSVYHWLPDGNYTIYLNDSYGDGGICGGLYLPGVGTLVENFCASGYGSSAAFAVGGGGGGCAEGEFTCNDGSCIPGSWECDVYWCDCGDCEDEADCGGGGCAADEYTCDDGSCIPGGYYCDGSSEFCNAGWGPDCADGSDEGLDECGYTDDCAADPTCAETSCGYYLYYGYTCYDLVNTYGYDCSVCEAEGVDCSAPACTNYDCVGTCADNYMSWVGDGYCDDGAYGIDFVSCNDWSCDGGDCGYGFDCAGDCGGSATEDCAGTCNGSATVDECGVCGGGGIADGACDCAGNVDAGCGCGEAGPSGCDNACGSTAANDECGVCGGDNSSCADCAGTPNGDATVDGCGTCDSDPSNDCPQDCAGEYGGDADYDCSGNCVAGWLFSYLGDGWCDGSDAAWGIDLSCYDCDGGDCSGACGCEDDSSCNDDCGVPNGDNSSCADCAGVPNGDSVEDYCGVCDGDNVANDCGEPEGCADGEFDCGDGTCIPGSWECDVYWCDCGDCSDEADCGGDDGGDCVNDDSSSDAYGDTCSSWYDSYESPGSYGCSGGYDDDDFNAAEQCCACQGAASPGDDDVVDSPHAGDKLAQAKLDYIETSETKLNTQINNNGSRDDCGGTGPDVGCDGVCFSGLEIDECGDCDGGGLNGDGCCYDLAADCNGDCGGDSFTDCSGNCVAGWLMSYLGDGWCDGSGSPYGVDFSCNDCDNGDCASDCNGDCEGTATEDCAGDCGGTAELDFCGVCAGGNTCEEGGDDGGDDGGSACEAGYVADCVDDDCCPESWIGDGFADCEEQAYGCDLTCYDDDGGDCADDGGDTGGSEACSDCAYDFTPYGSECCDTAAAEYGLSCAQLEGNYNWDCTGCACPLDSDEPASCADQGLWDCGDGQCIPAGYVCDGSSEFCNASWGADCSNGADEGLESCGYADECDAGGGCSNNFVEDCSGDGDCAPDYWVGDGWCDGTDEPYGYDLTCYDNDGGDCDGRSADSAKSLRLDQYNAKKLDMYNYEQKMAEYDAANASRDSACDGSWSGSDFGCDGVCFSGLADEGCGCGEGPLNGDGCCYDIAADCAGDCGGDSAEDCSGNCVAGWLFSYLGDGWCDGSDAAWGIDLTCYDCDNGDCSDDCGDCEGGNAAMDDCGECYGSNDCHDCAGVPYGDSVDDCSGDGGCFSSVWVGDGLCDGADQAWGADLTCYDCDGGDCIDECGVCDGSGIADGECDCDGNTDDCCGECGGDNSTCGGSGDINGGGVDVTDVVAMVGDILGTTALDECGANDADMNGDGGTDVMDVILAVEAILSGQVAGCTDADANNYNADADYDDGSCTYDPPTCADQGLWDCGDGQCIPAGYVCDGSSEFCNASWGPDCANGADEGLESCGYTDDCVAGACDGCEFDWTAYGSECCDTAAGEYGLDCATLEGTYGWDCSGCECPLDGAGDDGGSEIPDGWTCPDNYYTDTWCDCGCGAYDPVCDDPSASQWDNCGAGQECVDPTSTDCTESASSEACSDCEYDFTNYGSECCDTAWDEYGIDCATLEGTYGWDCSGCNCPGDSGEPQTCADQGLWDCGDGQCIPAGYVCDGSSEFCNAGWGPDCDNGADEGLDACGYTDDCGVAGECGDGVCGEDEGCGDDGCFVDCGCCEAEYTCDAGSEYYGYCVPDYWVCDGWDDCADAADEAGCDDEPEGCADGEFDCGDGTCIPGSWECDVYWCDCGDCSDEADCGGDDGGECVNDDSSVDAYGDTCSSWYDAYESPGSYGCSGGYDTDDFSAAEQCCACGGGSTGGRATVDSDKVMKMQGQSKLHGLDVLRDIAIKRASAVQVVETAVKPDDSMVTKSIVKHNAKKPVDVIQPETDAPLGRKAAPKFESTLQRAESVKLIQTAEGLGHEADGYVGFEITLSHGADFTINVTESAFIADYSTIGNTTKVIVVGPETENLFSSIGDYTIIDVIAGTSGGTALSADIVYVPTVFGLDDAYPNPFNPTTSVELAMPQDGFVSIKVYNLMGQVVATLHEGNLTANTYSFAWDAANVASGMYFLKAETAGNVDIQKIMLMK